MKQTLKIGAMLLVVAALATTGVALAQSGNDDAGNPVTAGTTATDTAGTVDERPLRSQIIEWLAPLVEDGTIDQSQAEAVADTLAEAMPQFHGRMGRGIEALQEAADFLGLTPAEVVEALRDGQTLADIAVAQGSSAEALIDHLTALAAEHLDELVADGRITADEKAEMLANMTERLTDLVNGAIDRPLFGGPGMGRGHHGMGGNGPCLNDDTELDELGA